MNFSQTGQVIEASRILIDRLRRVPSNTNPEKAGGYLVIGSDAFKVSYTLKIGDIPSEKESKYFAFAREKAHRLFSDWSRDPSSVSSWQTRQPELNRWGGAVLFPLQLGRLGNSCDILSFSGLIEHADEALGLMLGYQFGLVKDPAFAERVIQISGNKVYKELAAII